MPGLILVTGGARSGKSDFAQELAHRSAGDDVLFVATAEAGDEDMARRIRGTQIAPGAKAAVGTGLYYLRVRSHLLRHGSGGVAGLLVDNDHLDRWRD